MCGICGIASPLGQPDPGRLDAMSRSLAHRGPDSSGEHLDGPEQWLYPLQPPHH